MAFPKDAQNLLIISLNVQVSHWQYTIVGSWSLWLQDKEWGIVNFSKNKIDQFKRIIPLIADMRNPAIRDRYLPKPKYPFILEMYWADFKDWHRGWSKHILKDWYS